MVCYKLIYFSYYSNIHLLQIKEIGSYKFKLVLILFPKQNHPAVPFQMSR